MADTIGIVGACADVYIQYTDICVRLARFRKSQTRQENKVKAP